MTMKKAKAAAGQDKQKNIIPPERQEELKALAKYEALLVITEVTSDVTSALLSELSGDDWGTAVNDDDLARITADSKFQIIDTDKFSPKTDNVSENVFYWKAKWNYFIELMKREYAELSQIIIPLMHNPTSRKIIIDNRLKLDRAGDTLAKKIKKFNEGRHPTPGSFEVAELIYNAVMEGLRPPVPFEAARDFFIKHHCREGTSFAKQIMNILYGKMKPKKREIKKPPTLPTLKSWLQIYMDTMTETTEEKQHTKPKGEAKP